MSLISNVTPALSQMVQYMSPFTWEPIYIIRMTNHLHHSILVASPSAIFVLNACKLIFSVFYKILNVIWICVVFSPLLVFIGLRRHIACNVLGIMYLIPWYVQALMEAKFQSVNDKIERSVCIVRSSFRG